MIKIDKHIAPPASKVVQINDGLRKQNKKLKRLLKHAVSLIPKGVRDDKFFEEIDELMLEK